MRLRPVLLAAGLLACATAAAAQDHSTHGAGATGAEAPSTTAYKAANATMHAATGIPFTGNPDVDFARGMIPTIRAHSTWPVSNSSTEPTRNSAPSPRR